MAGEGGAIERVRGAGKEGRIRGLLRLGLRQTLFIRASAAAKPSLPRQILWLGSDAADIYLPRQTNAAASEMLI